MLTWDQTEENIHGVWDKGEFRAEVKRIRPEKGRLVPMRVGDAHNERELTTTSITHEIQRRSQMASQESGVHV